MELLADIWLITFLISNFVTLLGYATIKIKRGGRSDKQIIGSMPI